jgi:hypothetical protein
MPTTLQQTSINATIPIGGSYDNTKFMLGNILTNNTQEIIPLLTDVQVNNLRLNNNKIGFKVFDTTNISLFVWNGLSWTEINDSIASNLVSNTINGQININISSTNPPQIGQALVAISETAATWQDIHEGPTQEDTVILGATFATNQPYKVIEGVATKITSLDSNTPYIDGMVLESGNSGNEVPVASESQQIYTTVLALPGSDNSVLYLGQNGLLTATVPSVLAGDLWSVPIARRITSTTFIFSPHFLTHL